MRTNKAYVCGEKCFVHGALTEVMMASDRWIFKRRVQPVNKPKKLLWLVMGKNGKSDFERHTFFSEGRKSRPNGRNNL
jgi:hypothetical protein